MFGLDLWNATDLTSLSGPILVFVLAGLVKGVIGLGLPTISMALLALFMPPVEAAALLILPSLLTNVLQIGPWTGLRARLGRLGGMQLGIALGTLAGAWALGAPAGAWASLALGSTLIGYAAWSLLGRPLTIPPQTEKWLGPAVGATTGLISSATGVFVVPAVPYLQGLGLQRDALIQAMGLSFTVSTLALAGGLYLNDSYSASALGHSAVMLFPALLGMHVGGQLRQRLSPLLFRRSLMGGLILLGLHMIVHAAKRM